jgi:hypothetical protein
MGMNYYWKIQVQSPCEYLLFHIGKSCAGWRFALHVDPEGGISGLEDWIELWTRTPGLIVDEYDRVFTPEKILKIITNRPPESMVWKDDDYVVSHGPGPWDCLIGDFA